MKETFLRRSSIAPCNLPKQLPLEFRKLGTVGIENVVIRREINKIIPRVLRIRVTKPLGEKFEISAGTIATRAFRRVVKNGLYKEGGLCSEKFSFAQLVISFDGIFKGKSMK